MTDEQTPDAGFRITVGTVFTAVQDVKTEVAALRTEQALVNQSVTNMLAAMTITNSRVEKLEGRFNSVLVGIGVGVVTALVAVFRGVVG